MADEAPLPPELGTPLAPFAGEKPPAPAWFDEAIAREPERSSIAVDGVDIELLTWGEVGKPGLLFLHGNGAHADWWSFIAPFFADDWRVAAISWSGMGGSGWREKYDGDQFVSEAFTAAEAAGLYADGGKPVFVGHSFGSYPTMLAAAKGGDRLRAAVSVDSPIRPPSREWKGPPSRNGPNRVYATLTDALARFRLAPPQPCENLYIVDFIGRRSVRAVEGGFAWKFDPNLWKHFSFNERPGRPQCPSAFMWGQNSALIDPEVLEYMHSLVAPGTPMIELPQAHHHVMLDQPLAFVAALRGLLAGWPRKAVQA